MRLRNHEGLHQKEHHPTNHATISNYHAITLNCNGIAKLQKIAIRLIGLHQNCTDCMQRRPASERDQQQCSPVLDTENIRTAIPTAIFTIELNCGEIAKPQRIARGLKGLHQNRGKSTNCKKTSPVAPRNDIHSQSKPGPKYRDGNPDHNLHNRIELRRDCEIAKDCQGAERIAPKSRIIHNPRPDQSDFQAICTAIAMQIHNRITINAIRLQSTKSNWIATRLPGDRRVAPKSRDIRKFQPSPIAPRIGLPRKSVGDPPEVPQCRHNLLQFRAIQRIGTGLQIQCNPVSTRPT